MPKALGRVIPSRDWCRLAKGTHLLMPAVLNDEALLLTAQSDGRVFFMIPWYGLTLLGTTDTDYTGDVDTVRADDSDIDYLLAAANGYLKTPWSKADIIGAIAEDKRGDNDQAFLRAAEEQGFVPAMCLAARGFFEKFSEGDGSLIADLSEKGAQHVVAHGGRGGHGGDRRTQAADQI